MSLFQQRFLLLTVFVTGASILIIEILALRILAPYFGNTLYVASSVISTILAALSLGYYRGGIIADRYPRQGIFYGLIFVSACGILLTYLLGLMFLPMLSLWFSIATGSLLASLGIFFLPAFFLGMLSPFVIKLLGNNPATIGSQSGKVFFWSTLGSIAGSLLAGFVLIPHLGIHHIIISVAVLLGVWGMTGFFFFEKPSRYILGGSMMLFLILLMALLWYPLQKASGVIYERDGRYEKIAIVDRVQDGRDVRLLLLDRSESSGIEKDSGNLLFEYTKYYALYKLFVPSVKHALVLGGGTYSIPQALLKDSQNVLVDVVEIEPQLFSLAKTYFGVESSPRLRHATEDGRRFLRQTDSMYDVIISDIYYSFFSIPSHVTTREFFTLAKAKLSPGGVFIGNFAGELDPKPPSFIWSEIRTFQQVFPHSYFFAVESPQFHEPQNIIFLGVQSDEKKDFSKKEMQEYMNPIFNTLAEKRITVPEELSQYDLLTDDFSPVDYLVGKSLLRWY